MTEKDMIAHIKTLSKIIEKQNEFSERLTRNFYNMERSLTHLNSRIMKLEGVKERDLQE